MPKRHDIGVDPGLLFLLDLLLSERNVTRAAERAGITQPAVSRALARLRRELDDPLLVRSGRGMVLTPRAEQLAQPVHAALELLARALVREGAFEPVHSTRRFCIATVDYAVVALVLPLLATMREKAPRIELLIQPLAASFEEELASGRLDLAILPRRRSSPTLVWRKLLVDPFMSVVRRDHPVLRGRPSVAEFAALSHVVVSPEASARNRMDERLRTHGLTRHVALRVPSFLPALAAVAASELVLTAPRSLVRSFEGPLALAGFQTPIEAGSLTLSMVWHERQRKDPGHHWLRGQLAIAARS